MKKLFKIAMITLMLLGTEKYSYSEIVVAKRTGLKKSSFIEPNSNKPSVVPPKQSWFMSKPKNEIIDTISHSKKATNQPSAKKLSRQELQSIHQQKLLNRTPSSQQSWSSWFTPKQKNILEKDFNNKDSIDLSSIETSSITSDLSSDSTSAKFIDRSSPETINTTKKNQDLQDYKEWQATQKGRSQSSASRQTSKLSPQEQAQQMRLKTGSEVRQRAQERQQKLDQQIHEQKMEIVQENAQRGKEITEQLNATRAQRVSDRQAQQPAPKPSMWNLWSKPAVQQPAMQS